MKLLVVLTSVFLAVNAAPQQNYGLPGSQGSFDTRNTGATEARPSFGEPFSPNQPQQQRLSSAGARLPTIPQPDIRTPARQFQAGTSSQQSGSSFSSDQSFSVSGEQSFTGQVAQVSSFGSPQLSSNKQLTQTAGQKIVPSTQFQPTSAQENFIHGSSQESSRTVGSDRDCPEGQTLHVDGSCVTPEVTRHVFVYAAPETSRTANIDPTDIPLPKVEHNIVFIRTDELASRNDPIIIPPPQKKHIIYVLNKESQLGGQRVIEITTPKPKEPEVYFVNYAEGQTPTLPDGIDFETALNSAIEAEGQVIDGSRAFDVANEQTTNIATNVGASSEFSNVAASAGFDPNYVSDSSSNIRENFKNQEFIPNAGSSSGFGNEITSAGFNTNSLNLPSTNTRANIQGQGFSVNIDATSEFNNERISAGFDATHVGGSTSNIRGNFNNQAANIQGSAAGVFPPSNNDYSSNNAVSSVQDNIPNNNFGVLVSDRISVSNEAATNTLQRSPTNSKNMRVNIPGFVDNAGVPNTRLYGGSEGITNIQSSSSNNFASTSVVTGDVQDNISSTNAVNAVRPDASATSSNNIGFQSAGASSFSGAQREATLSSNNFQASSVGAVIPQAFYNAP